MSTSRKEANLRNYSCAHCRKEVTISKAVASDGIAFLFGKEDGYYALICPACRKTSILEVAMDELESLKHRLFEVMGDLEASNHPRLQYNSFPYKIDYVMRASRMLKRPFIKPLSRSFGNLSKDEIGNFFDNERGGSEGYLTYGMGDTAMGPAIAVWRVGKENIEQLLRAENNSGLKVVPRYVLYDPLIAAIQNFCWKYQMSENPISELELSAYPELQGGKLRDSELNLDIAKINEFLGILEYPDPQTVTDDEDADETVGESHTEIQDLRAEIGDNLESQTLQRGIASLADKFIIQFPSLARRTDFTVSDVNKLKSEYTGNAYRLIRNLWKTTEKIELGFAEECDISLDLSESCPDSSELQLEQESPSEIDREENRDWEPSDHFEGTADAPFSEKLQTYTHRDASYPRVSNLSLSNDDSEQDLVFDDTSSLSLDSGISEEEERAKYQSELASKVIQLEKRFSSLKKIVTRNPDLMELKHKISEVAKFNTDVLILGETGTGKELFAHAIHQISGREGNFAAINCSAIPKDLFESELFGHKKGAFSGAYCDKRGAFEYANHGTLFLDEIGEMPLEMQAKVLRAVEYRTINRLGSMDTIHLDLRIIFATNRDLKKEADEGRFRKDLFFRIFSPSFRIIPLRERIEDIPVLVEHFLDISNEKFQKNVESVSPDLMNIFRRYTWDGNVRELMKVIEMGVINSAGSQISKKEISYFSDLKISEQAEPADRELPPASKITDEDIKYWMEKLNFNKSQVARRLGVSYRTILRRSKAIYQ